MTWPLSLRQSIKHYGGVEDEIQACEYAGNFSHRFIELARSIYQHNDRRAVIKKRINTLLGSRLVEEKLYG